MARTADYLIIGGGIVGCSIAYHLAKRGAKNIAVVEQAALGSGSTAKAAGGIRAQFAAEVTIRMSLYAQNIYRHFEEEFGVEISDDEAEKIRKVKDAVDYIEKRAKAS